MADQFIFQRVEKKYLLTEGQYKSLVKRLGSSVCPDEYGLHTICNLYYDTPEDELIRTSIEKPRYKEKLRLRSYGIPTAEKKVFLEIKKKYAGIVYKRRIALMLKEAERYLEKSEKVTTTGQVERELEYVMKFYDLKPKLFIAYERRAYYDPQDPSVRITFDFNIRSREDRLDLKAGDDGTRLLPEGSCLMEIKIGSAFPIWLSRLLSELKIYPVSFSKYGRIYQTQIEAKIEAQQKNIKMYRGQQSICPRKESAECLQVSYNQ